MNSKKHSLSQKGFTLVELLIVIVIIGILAGVVIGVLNPVQQQNRARDAATRSAIDKIALSTKSLWSSGTRTLNKTPTQAEFIQGLSNRGAHDCTSAVLGADVSCTFSINGLNLPQNCGANSVYNVDNGAPTPCEFAYVTYSVGQTDEFRIAARGFAAPERLFVFHFQETVNTGDVVEGFWDCPVDKNVLSTAAAFDPNAAGSVCSRIN